MKSKSFNQRHHGESCGLMSNTMCEAGYTSIFQYALPAIDSETVYTLWVNLRTGKQVMATVSPRGEIDYYDLTENRQLKPAHSYSDNELSIIEELRGVSGIVGTTEG